MSLGRPGSGVVVGVLASQVSYPSVDQPRPGEQRGDPFVVAVRGPGVEPELRAQLPDATRLARQFGVH